MNTSTKNILKNIFTLLFLSFAFASCSNEEGADLLANVLERTDIVISGDMQMSEFQVSEQNDATRDLVRQNFYGAHSDKIDFEVELSGGFTLKIQVIDAENGQPWEQVGNPYNVYPSQILEDKTMYVVGEVITGEDSPAYATNVGTYGPEGIMLDVFQITSNDGVQIRARIRDMKLYKNADPAKTITINGTFVGALDF